MSDFDLLAEFCQKMLCDGKINHHQYNYLVCGWSEGKSEEYLSEMNLNNAFAAYQRELERQKIDNEYQAGVVQDLINQKTINLDQAKLELEPLQQEYDSKKALFDNWDQRYKMYPENMRFKKEFEKIQGEIDEIQSKMLKVQQEVENFEQQIRLWNTELIELKR